MSAPHHARKRFGQHFLIDADIIQHIVAVIAPKPEDHLVEIGPGLGAITAALLQAAGKLEVVEIDRDLIPELQKRYSHLGTLTIHQADVLEFDFTRLAHGNSLRLVGNLPYNISTPLIFHLLEQAHVIHDMYFMLQKEVVARMAAQVGDDAYGRLSIMVQYRAAITALFTVPPTAFDPPPQVDSQIVRLVPYHKLPYPAQDEACFSKLVKLAFNQRRKTLRNALKTFINDEQWDLLPVNPRVRAEELSVIDYVNLSNTISNLFPELIGKI